MELPSKLLGQKAFNAKLKIEEHMLIAMDKSKSEEKLSQLLQINNKQPNVAVTFLTVYCRIFNVTNRNNKCYFTTAIDDDDFSEIVVYPWADELESLNDEIKRSFIEEGSFTEENYPSLIKANFSNLVSFIES